MLRRPFAPTLVLALLLVGCGGRGSSRSTAPAASMEAKAVVTRTVTDYYSTCNYQVSGPLWFGGGLDAPAGDAAYPPSVNDPIGGAPEAGPFPTAYQNDGLGLWENLPNGDYSREDFYTDRTMAQTAGFCTEEIGGTDAVSTDAIQYEITAGPYAGAHGESNSTSTTDPEGDGSDDLWHASYTYTAADGTVYAGTFDYKGLSYTSTCTTTRPDGTKDTISASADAQSRGTIAFVSHTGVTLTIKSTDYGTATGTLTGDATGLPARFSQDTHTDKPFIVRFHDGSVATFGGEAAAQFRQASAMRSVASRRRARMRALLRR